MAEKFSSNWEKVDNHTIHPEEYDEAPELTDAMLSRARWFHDGVAAKVYVSEIRAKTALTQKEFAETFGFSLGTLRKWERGERYPTGAARALLSIIDHNPQLALTALHSY